MPKKLNYEEVKNKFKDCGYELLDKEYKSATAKMKFKTKDGYIAQVAQCHIIPDLTLGTFFSKNNKFSMKNVNTYINKNTRCKLRTTKFEFNPSGLVPLICECGKEFDTLWHSVYRNNNILCQDCTNEKSRGLNKHDSNKVKTDLLNRGYELISEYSAYGTPVEVLELSTNYKGYIMYSNAIKEQTKLIPFIFPLNEKNYLHNMRQFIKINNGNVEILDYATKTNSAKTTYLKCKCSCGDIFTVSHGHILAVKGELFCEKCNRKLSNLERKTILWLEENKIDFIRQFKFKDCKNILPLPFDFYLPIYNVCIEVDGEQHMRNDTQYDKTEEDFKLRQKRDDIKTNYCKDNNIKLIRIPYYDFNKDIYKETLTNNILGQN